MKNTVLFIVMLLLPVCAIAQRNLTEKQSQIIYDTPLNGPQGGFQKEYDKAKKDELVSQLRTAKINRDTQKCQQLMDEIENVTGNISKKVYANDNNGPIAINQIVNQPVSISDYNSTMLNTEGNWSTATSTDRYTGRIYVAVAANNPVGSDTLKLFTSTDNGISWILVNKMYYGTPVKFRSDELDIEAVNNGTTSYAFIVAGLSLSNIDYSGIYRMNSSGSEYFVSNLFTSSLGNRYLFPRITSDNSRYTSASFIFLMVTNDTLTHPLHNLRTKFSMISNPFAASPIILERNFDNNYYSWSFFAAADSMVMYNDIAYSDSSGTDCIITVSNFFNTYAYMNLYMTRSNDYGATVPSWQYWISESNLNYKPRIAATGLDILGNQSIVINYVRKNGGASNWDTYFQRTSNNGATWFGNFVDNAIDTVVYADVIAIPNVANTFRFAYTTMTNNTNGTAYVKTYNNGFLGNRFQLNQSSSAVNNTPIRAGYRYAPTDSCFAVVEGFGGYGLYAYSGCSGGLIGIVNNETPVSFKLSQNYPNPFNPTTKISYAIPKSGLVTLKIYDILGKEVVTLVNEVKAAGNYSVDFNASNYTSGVYFYKIETNGFSDIKKMMLIK